MGPANQYGPEYLTYVLWAITPEGRPKNLGEVVLNGTVRQQAGRDHRTTGLRTDCDRRALFRRDDAERRGGDGERDPQDTVGKVEEIDAKYELLPRGQYTMNVAAGDCASTQSPDPKRPLEVLEARNAVQIAQWAGADRYASRHLPEGGATARRLRKLPGSEASGEEARGDDRAGSCANRRGCAADHCEADGRRAPG